MTQRLEAIAVIPARGGSKTVPGKNIRRLSGIPLIAHTIRQAKKAHSLSRVIVSTDDRRIASVAGKYGAEVVARPARLSTDKASSELALLHALEYLKKAEGYRPDILVFIQCTSPLIVAEDIDGIVRAFLRERADSALTVVPFHGFLWKKGRSGKATGINHSKSVRIRRQDLKPQYQETGGIYVMNTKGFLKAKNRFFGRIALYEIPSERGMEINDLTDFYIAQALLRQRGLEKA